MVHGSFLTEFGKVILAVPPIDTTGAAQNGLWVSMAKYNRATVIIAVGNQTTISTPAVTLEQATSSAGAGGKALSFDWKVTSTAALSQSNDTYTRAAVSSDTFNLVATDNMLYMIDIRDTQLDIANDFKYFRVAIASPGANACPICVLYVLYDADFCSQANQPTVVA